jgi:hypothetical protein
MIAAGTKDEQSSTAIKYNLRISVNETTAVAVVETMDMRTKIVTNNKGKVKGKVFPSTGLGGP